MPTFRSIPTPSISPLIFGDVSRKSAIHSQLKEISPSEFSSAFERIREYFAAADFREVILSPFTAYPIDYQNEVMDVPGVGQLRFNTEPEIWEQNKSLTRFFSLTTLFRKEADFNILRRPAFTIVDFYQNDNPESMLTVFVGLLHALAKDGIVSTLHRLPFEQHKYDSEIDGPQSCSQCPCWILTTDYDPSQSFFEVAEDGSCTRSEIFLATPTGYLEIGALGRVGYNRNPSYVFRGGPAIVPLPPPNYSGMGIGLERLLLAEQILTISH